MTKTCLNISVFYPLTENYNLPHGAPRTDTTGKVVNKRQTFLCVLWCYVIKYNKLHNSRSTGHNSSRLSWDPMDHYSVHTIFITQWRNIWKRYCTQNSIQVTQPPTHKRQIWTASSLYLNMFRPPLVIVRSHVLKTDNHASNFIYITRLQYYVVLKYLCTVSLKLLDHASVHNR